MTPTLTVLLLAALTWTADQRAMLESVRDGPRFEEPGLYPLLERALAAGSESEAGATVPDYDALLADPAAHRGERFLLEGRFAGRARRFGLYRHGDWGEALTEWAIVTGDPADPDPDVAVIYFVDPAGQLAAPRPGTPVRTVGAFYKRWSDRDAHGRPTDYLVFIAGDTRPTRAAAPSSEGWTLGGGVLLFVLLALPLLLWLRRAAQRRPMERRGSRTSAGDVADRLEAHLPVDPADALAELERRGEASDGPEG